MRLILPLLAGCTQPHVTETSPPRPLDDTSAPNTTMPTTDPPADSWCGDQVCQEHEDDEVCPWDCVPYTVDPEGGSQGRACERVATGFVPLTELGTGRFLGVADGGLYAGGTNERPTDHTAAGLALAEGIAPIDGKICVMSVGMSNTGQKWNHFTANVAPDIVDLNPAVVLANGAVGGNPVDTTADAEHRVWGTIERQLDNVGCSLDTAQVAWVLHAERGPSGTFAEAMEVFQDDLMATVLNLADRAPNLRLVYLSPRVYAGYGTRNNNPEPYAHQGAFAIKALVASQIEESDPELALTAGAPWLSWGPYLWADGLRPREDGLTYACEDFSQNDGIHPGPGSLEKVGAQLEAFFTTDPTATPWFRQ